MKERVSDNMLDRKKMDECQGLLQVLVTQYEEKLSKCDKVSLQDLELIYLGRKLETYKGAKPKGDTLRSEERRKEVVEHITEIIKRKIKEYYGYDNVDIESFLHILKLVSKADPNSAYKVLDEFKKACTEVASNTVGSLKTILPEQGLGYLEASHHRENQYYNDIVDGVFAVSDYDDLIAYSMRAVCNPSGMVSRNNEIHYPDNPIVEIDDPESVMLKRPVSIYSSDAKKFEPVVDFKLVDGKPKIIFGSEWVAKVDKIDAFEDQIGRVPRDFFKDRKVYVRDNDHEICLSDSIKKRV